MDANGGRSSIISGGSSCNNNNNNNNTNIGGIGHHDSGSEDGHHDSGSEDDQMMMMMEDLRRGPWTVEEDLTLMSYITNHGEGRWNSLARLAGLKRTGKSCRLRWLNYLRPDVRRGNITLEEQLLILELHSRWGNRWSKIAQHLPGRTDNEIKNYWRTRVQKHAKQLKCDVNSKQFKDTMRYLWMPRLVERIQAASASGVTGDSSGNSGHHFNGNNIINDHNDNNIGLGQLVHVPATGCTIGSEYGGGAVPQVNNPRSSYTNDLENSISTAASSDSFGAQVSPVSDLTDNYNNYPGNYNNANPNYFQAAGQVGYTDSLISPSGYYYNNNNNNNNSQGGIDFQSVEQNNNNQWSVDGTGDVSDSLWNVEDIWFLQQQFTNNI